MNKDQIRKIGKYAAFFAVFGVTGAAALLAYNLYRVSKGLEKINLDDIKL